MKSVLKWLIVKEQSAHTQYSMSALWAEPFAHTKSMRITLNNLAILSEKNGRQTMPEEIGAFTRKRTGSCNSVARFCVSPNQSQLDRRVLYFCNLRKRSTLSNWNGCVLQIHLTFDERSLKSREFLIKWNRSIILSIQLDVSFSPRRGCIPLDDIHPMTNDGMWINTNDTLS